MLTIPERQSRETISVDRRIPSLFDDEPRDLTGVLHENGSISEGRC
jgi:hypothetical protein